MSTAMSKLLTLSLTLTVPLLACTADSPSASIPQDSKGAFEVSIWTDSITGCQYLVTGSSRATAPAITPRLARNGKPICNSE